MTARLGNGTDACIIVAPRRLEGYRNMSLRSLLPDAVDAYVHDVATRETPLQRRLRDETAKLPNAGMQIGSDQGAFLALLVRLTAARRALEIGTFTGYSALALATALPPPSRLTLCH